MPEYLFDAYVMRPRDGREHVFQLGHHHVGEASVASPEGTQPTPARNPDGTPWDPFESYRKNTRHEGLGFTTQAMWQVEWTINEGGLWDGKNLPKGTRLRLIQAASPGTEVVLAWLKGPRRQEGDEVRQDFVVSRRKAMDTCFVSAYDPIAAGAEPFVKSVEVAKTDGGARAVKVTTARGVDWFLVGGLPDFTKDLSAHRASRAIGPFSTDAALAVVRVRGGSIAQAMFAGGTRLTFESEGQRAEYSVQGAGTHHVPGGR